MPWMPTPLLGLKNGAETKQTGWSHPNTHTPAQLHSLAVRFKTQSRWKKGYQGRYFTCYNKAILRNQTP